MTVSDLFERISAGTAPAVLDVRSRGEFTRGHVPGALRLSFLLSDTRVCVVADQA